MPVFGVLCLRWVRDSIWEGVEVTASHPLYMWGTGLLLPDSTDSNRVVILLNYFTSSLHVLILSST